MLWPAFTKSGPGTCMLFKLSQILILPTVDFLIQEYKAIGHAVIQSVKSIKAETQILFFLFGQIQRHEAHSFDQFTKALLVYQ